MLNLVNNFVSNSCLYPPIQIFGEKEVTKKSKKAEERCVEICEELFRYNKKTPKDVRYLSELVAAYRDLEVALKMSEDFNVKEEYLVKVLVAFMQSAAAAITQMNLVYKKDQALWTYYQGIQMSQKDIKDCLIKYLLDTFSPEYGVSVVKSFKEELVRK